MALSITDLKKGTIFQLDGTLYRVVDYSQKVMGRGGSIVNVRIKSLLDGHVEQKTFKGNEQLESANISSRNLQYLYNDGARFYFMDPESYEQYEVDAETMDDKKGYVKEGEKATAQFFGGSIINIELPKNVALKVTYTENAVRGDTSTAITKEAQLETGMTVKVPAFIKTGDIISIDTATGAYRERIKE